MRSRLFKSAILVPVLVFPFVTATSALAAASSIRQISHSSAAQDAGVQRAWAFSIYGDSGLDFVSTGVSASVLLERSRKVMQQFLAAYNREGTRGVLNLMNFHYVDPTSLHRPAKFLCKTRFPRDPA